MNALMIVASCLLWGGVGGFLGMRLYVIYWSRRRGGAQAMRRRMAWTWLLLALAVVGFVILCFGYDF